MRTRGWGGTARAGDSDLGFGSRSGIIATGNTGLVSAQRVGQREVSRGSHPAFAAAGCSLHGKKPRILELLFLLNIEVRNYGVYKALEGERELSGMR